ncbi:MAG: oligoendopeptidase F, partial [Ignavibacteria bacterium RBG_13_36_8]
TATSWINPEMLQIPWDTMKKWLDKTPALAPYRFDIEDLYRQQAHVLDEEKEKLISYYTRFNGTPNLIYTDLSTADIDFPTITLSTGDEITATSGNYSRVLATNRNQEDRKKIFEAHYNTFKKNENTYASIYNAVCQRDWANAQTRNYNSTLEANLDNNNIPIAVYENLVNTVRANTAPLQKYARLRAKILGLKEYHQYDGSIPIIDFDETYPYNEAKDKVEASVAPLGEDYQKRVERALAGGWIDVFENTGKRTGAYSSNVYGVHPYMLLNYNETMDYVFTLCHEIGHTIHTMLANENQPFATSGYTLFVAEVASTFNERLLLDNWLDKAEDPKERVALLLQAIKNITNTFYFQALLADFELQVHRLAEEGKPITAKELNGIMKDLFTAYYGDSVVHDDLINTVWARISHFYTVPYYVYQYATCFASSAKIYDDIKNKQGVEKQKAIDRYLNLLKSGGNDYPMEQLKKAGVDLSTPEPYLAIINQFDKMVDQLGEEVEKLEK